MTPYWEMGGKRTTKCHTIDLLQQSNNNRQPIEYKA